MTSDTEISLLAAMEQWLKTADRQAVCIEDPRAPERIV
jgi:hypothetical protein